MKGLVCRYSEICGELSELSAALERGHFPENSPQWLACSQRVGQLRSEKMEADNYANSLPWNKRRLVMAVMKHGPRWDLVRREIHSYKSADAVRMEYNRIFQK